MLILPKGSTRVKIIYIRTAKSRGYIRIGAGGEDGARDLVVSEQDYRAVGSPLVGDAIDSSALLSLLNSDMRYRGRLYALRMLSYADNNEKNLCRKLVMKGISRDVAAEVAAEMVGLGYINESRQLDRLIADEVGRKLIGPKKLFPKLLAKGYSHADIEASVDKLICEGIIDFEASRQALIEKHQPADELELKKLLYKNGYEIC